MTFTSPASAATIYMERGYSPIPVAAGHKKPIGNEWQKQRLTPADVDATFKPNINIGIQLGEPSQGLVDVDIDDPLAKRLTHLLPPTAMIHGRTGNPESHRWYQIECEVPRTAQFKNPVTGEMIIELRSTGGQTVVPPSRYLNSSSNERSYLTLNWEEFGHPGVISGNELLKAVGKVAAATLVAGNWNRVGSRHTTSLAMAGTLLRGGMAADDVRDFIEAVCVAADDDEPEDRIATVEYTQERLAANEPATGATALGEILDPRVVSALQKWLGLSRAPAPSAHTENGPMVWDDVVLFDDIATPEIPAGLLPVPFGPFASALANTAEVSESLTTMTVLGIISASCGKRFVVSPMSGWNEPCNLYILQTLPPANNKSLVQGSCTAPIDRWEARQRDIFEPLIKEARSQRRNEESQINSQRAKAAKVPDKATRDQMFADVTALELNLTEIPVAPQIYLNDVTPETLSTAVSEQGGRIAIISDEGGIMETMGGLYSKGHANYDSLLKGIDGGRVRLKRKDRDLDINPYITMLLVVQPQIVRNMSDRKAFHGRGLLERFLYVLPKSRLGFRQLTPQPIPRETTKDYETAVRSLLEIPPYFEHGLEYPRILTLDPNALAKWQAFRYEIEAQLRPDGKLQPCLGWGGKIVGFCLRIAGLLHVGAHGLGNTVIALPTMENAITIARALTEHALVAFGIMGEDEAADDAQAILAWIIREGQPRFRRTDCLRKLHGRFTSKKRFDQALASLHDRNIIGPVRQEITTAGKRATLYYEVNPQLLDQPPA